MKNIYVLVITVLLLVLSGCDEGSKDNTISEAAKPILSNDSALSEVPDLKILKWGPQQTTVGTVVNKQPNGETAFWFQMVGSIKSGTKLELWFGDIILSDNIVLNKEMLSSGYLPTNLLGKEGEYPLYLIHAQSKKRFDIGIFKITPVPLVESTATTDIAPFATAKKSVKIKSNKNQ